jgi:predicted ribosomally synthesized peptide with SipW-like signal peptide
MRKIGLLIMVLVVSLGVLGIGYAAWTDEVTISGSVDTGEVCVEITCPLSYSDGLPASPPYTREEGATSGFDWNATKPPGNGFFIGAIQTDKDVGWTTDDCYVDLDGDGDLELRPSPIKTVTITFHNLYPCYLNHIGFGIYNCGSIPVKLDHVTFTDDQGDVQTIYNDSYLVFDLSGNGVNDFEIQWGDNFGDQIEPGGFWSIDFYAHFIQDEDIDFSVPHSYNLTIEVTVVQWNEWPLPK